ncbi:MAG: elongation factor Ts [Fibrobacter sp.]|nr:elongation factor Ts [Fibrobacter sp.]
MEVSAAVVKELRDKTGLGMMICKQAIIDANGDMTVAIENLRKQGQATAVKRADKAAKEGKVTIVSDATTACVYEVNSETDFVARNDDFVAFVDTLGKVLIEKKPADINAAKAIVAPSMGNITIEARVTELIGKIGENIMFRRYAKVDTANTNEKLFTYNHGNGKIGVVVKLSATAGLDSAAMADLGKDLAMQVAASNPMSTDSDAISPDVIAKEKEIYFTQAQTSGKPEKIWDKIVEGKLAKFFQEVTLVGQPFVKNPEISIAQRIAETEKELTSKIKVLSFIRMERGAE